VPQLRRASRFEISDQTQKNRRFWLWDPNPYPSHLVAMLIIVARLERGLGLSSLGQGQNPPATGKEIASQHRCGGQITNSRTCLRHRYADSCRGWPGPAGSPATAPWSQVPAVPSAS